MKRFILICFAGVSLSILAGCEAPMFGSLSSDAKNIFSNFTSNKNNLSLLKQSDVQPVKSIELKDIIETAPVVVDFSKGFKRAIGSSAENNPKVLSANANYQARLASIDLVKSSKEFKFSGTFLGGVEDVSDETVGLAAIINGKRVIYDGGKIDSNVSKEEFLASAGFAEYQIKQNEVLSEALNAWIDLKRFNALNNLIQSRLEVLAPLIQQLEQVAAAGIGDSSQVAAAERTVNTIRAMEKEVVQQLDRAIVVFENIYGVTEPSIPFEGEALSAAISSLNVVELLPKAPRISQDYALYGAAIAELNSVIAKDSFDVGLETKVQRPFGGSGYDSDESIGLVVRKTLRDGGSLEAERKIYEARVAASLDLLKLSFRSLDKSLKEAQAGISSINDAIQLARVNANNARDEIGYLRQQLIIGQSTLDSVLSAEARLYEAESKAIHLASEQYMLEVTILSALGQLAPLIGLK